MSCFGQAWPPSSRTVFVNVKRLTPIRQTSRKNHSYLTIHLNALVSCCNRPFQFWQQGVVLHRRPLIGLLWTEPIIQHQLKFCYQVPQEPVRRPWYTWYSVLWQRTTVCFQRVQRIYIRLAFWPPNVLTTLSTIKWQDWKCCEDSQ